VHAESCRAVRWTRDRTRLLSASADRSVVATDAATGQAAFRLAKAHQAGVSRLVALEGTGAECLVATGDDDGAVKLWDLRQRASGAQFHPHVDFVSDICHEASSQSLLASSGDGTLSVLDLRAGRVRQQSDSLQDELLSVVALKGGSRAACGSQEGVLHVFDLEGDVTEPCDRVQGHPNSVDALLAVDDDTVLSGSSDGLVRVVSVQPSRLLGVVGHHDDFPVERIALDGGRRLLASAAHDNAVRVWDVAELFEPGEDGPEPTPGTAAAAARAGAVFAEAAGSDSDEAPRKKRKKGKRGAASGLRKGGAGAAPEKRNTFFDGLL